MARACEAASHMICRVELINKESLPIMVEFLLVMHCEAQVKHYIFLHLYIGFPNINSKHFQFRLFRSGFLLVLDLLGAILLFRLGALRYTKVDLVERRGPSRGSRLRMGQCFTKICSIGFHLV